MPPTRLTIEFRGPGNGAVDVLACAKYACSATHLYDMSLDVAGRALVLKAIDPGRQLWHIRGITPLPDGIAAVDLACKIVIKFTEVFGKICATTVAGAAFNYFLRDGPCIYDGSSGRPATFHMPRALASSVIKGKLFVADCNTVREVGPREVKTMSKAQGQVTAIAPSGLGDRTVVIGTMTGHIGYVSPETTETVLVLPGPVDALLVTSSHVALAAVSVKRSDKCRVYAVDLRSGKFQIVMEMTKRLNARPAMLAWCGNRAVAVGHYAWLLPWVPKGQPVLQCHYANWRNRKGWGAMAWAAARAFALSTTRRRNLLSVALPPELIDMVLHCVFFMWPSLA